MLQKVQLQLHKLTQICTNPPSISLLLTRSRSRRSFQTIWRKFCWLPIRVAFLWPSLRWSHEILLYPLSYLSLVLILSLSQHWRLGVSLVAHLSHFLSQHSHHVVFPSLFLYLLQHLNLVVFPSPVPSRCRSHFLACICNPHRKNDRCWVQSPYQSTSLTL